MLLPFLSLLLWILLHCPDFHCTVPVTTCPLPSISFRHHVDLLHFFFSLTDCCSEFQVVFIVHLSAVAVADLFHFSFVLDS
jgi:hypothetical protein